MCFIMQLSQYCSKLDICELNYFIKVPEFDTMKRLTIDVRNVNVYKVINECMK